MGIAVVTGLESTRRNVNAADERKCQRRGDYVSDRNYANSEGVRGPVGQRATTPAEAQDPMLTFNEAVIDRALCNILAKPCGLLSTRNRP
ncbi:hypothetical protein [Burkholderia sp. Bp8984]|uniref:hypothetical protein n=1 Tax=Burkholderia sp. Bp8984 TaxID=2184549 RepID=UPI000F59CBA1|nr:hypothetical protein [Burkholderia sp. Bp8984]